MQNNNKDRGMIKWRPFASLPEHMELIEQKNKTRKKSIKRRISGDKFEEMQFLVENSMKNSTNLVLKLYKNGEIFDFEGIAYSFDCENNQLIFKVNNKKERIYIRDIIDVYEK